MLYDVALQWRHNGSDSVSNHQPRECLLNRLIRCRSKETSKLRVTGLCAVNSPGTGEFPAQMASYAENVPFDDVIMEYPPETHIQLKSHEISNGQSRNMGAMDEGDEFRMYIPYYNSQLVTERYSFSTSRYVTRYFFKTKNNKKNKNNIWIRGHWYPNTHKTYGNIVCKDSAKYQI